MLHPQSSADTPASATRSALVERIQLTSLTVAAGPSSVVLGDPHRFTVADIIVVTRTDLDH
jgi:Ni2+-binding GTPase involved in maturation of urease and hydrogenase